MSGASRGVKIAFLPEDDQLRSRLRDAQASTDKLKASLGHLHMDVQGDKQAEYKLARLDLEADRLKRRLENQNLKVSGFEAASVKLLGLEAEAQRLHGSLSNVDSDAASAGRGVAGLGADLGALSNYAMPAAIGGLVALSGQAAVLAAGLGGVALAALRVSHNQALMAKTVAPLKAEYASFSKSLQPDVLNIFNEGVRAADNLLSDLQPVAKATSTALGGVLHSIDAEFRSGTWQQFFGFMEANAGPDVRQIGGLFTDLLNTIPPLAENLHTLGSGLVTLTDDAVKVVGPLSTMTKTLDVVNGLASKNSISTNEAAASLAERYLPNLKGLATWLVNLETGYKGSTSAAGKNADANRRVGSSASQAVAGIKAENAALNKQATALEGVLGKLSTYIDDTITEANDLHSLRKALQQSGDKIGYNTQKQRDSFSAAQTYIENTTKTADAALAAHRGIDTQISTIERALPVLESVRGKTAAYKQELQALKGILDRLRAERNIVKYVTVIHRDTYTQGGKTYQEFHARGGLIRGPGTGVSDSISARLSNGEYVIRASSVRAVGTGLLDRINSAGSPPGGSTSSRRFSAGGSVSDFDGYPFIGSGAYQPMELIISAQGDDLVTAIVKALRYEIRTEGGGNVQRHLGWGSTN